MVANFRFKDIEMVQGSCEMGNDTSAVSGVGGWVKGGSVTKLQLIGTATHCTNHTKYTANALLCCTKYTASAPYTLHSALQCIKYYTYITVIQRKCTPCSLRNVVSNTML